MSTTSIIEITTQILLGSVIGMYISIPLLVLILGSIRRSINPVSFLSLTLAVFPYIFMSRHLQSSELQTTVEQKGTEHKFTVTSNYFIDFTVKQEELRKLCEEYTHSNDLPMEGKDYPFLEPYQFYGGVDLNISACDHCGGSGTHLVNGRFLGLVSIQNVFCSDCFDEITYEVSKQIEENPELLVSSKI